VVQLSYSASEKYQMSPMSYYLHYILRLRPEKIGSALVFGSAVDVGINTLLENKMNNENKLPHEAFLKLWTKASINGIETDLRYTDLIKYSKSDYDENILTEQDKEAIEGGLNKSWVSLHRKGILMMEAYEKQVLPHIKEVLAVQKYVQLSNSHGDKFIGWIDFVCKWEDDKIYIVDNKTTSIKYKEDSVKTSPQLATYFEGVKKEIKADGAMYIAVPKKFRKRKEPLIPIDIIKDKIPEELIESTFDRYDDTLHGIKMGEFHCTGCEKNVFGCPYKGYCESNGEDTTGLIYVKDKPRKTY